MHTHGRYRSSKGQRHRMLTKPSTICTSGCPCYHAPPSPAPSQPLHYASGSETRAWNDCWPCALAQQHLSLCSQSQDLRASALTVSYTPIDFHTLTHTHEHRYMHLHLCTDTSTQVHTHTHMFTHIIRNNSIHIHTATCISTHRHRHEGT